MRIFHRWNEQEKRSTPFQLQRLLPSMDHHELRWDSTGHRGNSLLLQPLRQCLERSIFPRRSDGSEKHRKTPNFL